MERKFPPKRRSKNGWERRTYDNYIVLLFEEDGRWRCLVQLHDEDGSWKWKADGSAADLDEAKTESYAFVDALRARIAARKPPAKRTGKIASRAAGLPISTSRHKSRL